MVAACLKIGLPGANADFGKRLSGSTNHRKRVLPTLAVRLGLPKLTFQVIRRTIATLAQHLGSVKDVMGLLRHMRAPTTTDKYMQVTLEGVASTLIPSIANC
jgi:hypothetical protein